MGTQGSGAQCCLWKIKGLGYLLKPLFPSVIAQFWIEAMCGVERYSGGGRGGQQGQKRCVFKKKGLLKTKSILMWHSLDQSQKGSECVYPPQNGTNALWMLFLHVSLASRTDFVPFPLFPSFLLAPWHLRHQVMLIIPCCGTFNFQATPTLQTFPAVVTCSVFLALQTYSTDLIELVHLLLSLSTIFFSSFHCDHSRHISPTQESFISSLCLFLQEPFWICLEEKDTASQQNSTLANQSNKGK